MLTAYHRREGARGGATFPTAESGDVIETKGSVDGSLVFGLAPMSRGLHVAVACPLLVACPYPWVWAELTVLDSIYTVHGLSVLVT